MFRAKYSANRESVFLNWLFWSRHHFSKLGISYEQRDILLGYLKQCWEFNHIDIPLPCNDEQYRDHMADGPTPD